MRMAAQDFEDHIGIDRGAYLKMKSIHAAQGLLRWTYSRMRRALNGVPHELPAPGRRCAISPSPTTTAG